MKRTHPRYSTLYKIAGTEPFRLASTQILGSKKKEVLHGKWGGNLQNKNKDIRKYFLADEGKTMFQIDESGADALIVAYLCPPGCKFRELFINGIKPHTYCAATIFKPVYEAMGFSDIDSLLEAPINTLPANPKWRLLEKAIKDSDNEVMRYYYLGKKTIHGSNYDMRGNTMATAITTETDGAVNLSGEFCNKLLETWHLKMPEIRKVFHNETVTRASTCKGFLRNLFRHPREFTGRWEDATFREMYAFIPASTVALIIHYAVTEIAEDIYYNRIDNKKWGIDLLQNGHDSFLAQCWTEHLAEVVKYAQPKVERELTNFCGEKFRMKSEVQVGLNWGPKKKDNEDGLAEYF